MYSFDPVGSYQRDSFKAGGSASAMLQPLLDNQVRTLRAAATPAPARALLAGSGEQGRGLLADRGQSPAVTLAPSCTPDSAVPTAGSGQASGQLP